METLRETVLTSQPGKAAWVLLAIAFNAARLPIWLVYYFPRFMRPNRAWSLRQSVCVSAVRAFIFTLGVIEMKSPLSLEPGKEGDRFEVIYPAKKSSYTGVVDKDPEVQPEAVGGTWYPSRLTADKAALADVIIHFHGGAYVFGDGRIADAGYASSNLLSNSSATHCFCLQYRLSGNPGGRFPAALQDAITAYSHLLELGVPAEKITVSGDSAGGHLALSLLRYIADNADTGLPAPGCAFLWSPWVSPANALDDSKIAKASNYSTDYLPSNFGKWGAKCFAPSTSSGVSFRHPNIDFMDSPFKTPTPLYISTGECEMLLTDNVRLAEQFKSIPGNTVKLQLEEHAVHDILITARLIGFVMEAQRAVKRAGEFLASIRS